MFVYSVHASVSVCVCRLVCSVGGRLVVVVVCIAAMTAKFEENFWVSLKYM